MHAMLKLEGHDYVAAKILVADRGRSIEGTRVVPLSIEFHGLSIERERTSRTRRKRAHVHTLAAREWLRSMGLGNRVRGMVSAVRRPAEVIKRGYGGQRHAGRGRGGNRHSHVPARAARSVHEIREGRGAIEYGLTEGLRQRFRSSACL